MSEAAAEIHNSASNPDDVIDVVVIGGGITGAGVALAAARAGCKTVLYEQKDYSWGTSSRSSKMVHGGLRYIAQGDIRLTRESLLERELLLKELPGLVYRGKYVFPHRFGAFPGPFIFGWLLRFYDFLAGISDRQYISKEKTAERVDGLNAENLKGSSVYTDALTDDCRLVMRVLHEAEHNGAQLHNYSRVSDVVKRDGAFDLMITNEQGEQQQIRANVVVNATGAFADELNPEEQSYVRPLRGSHLVFDHAKIPVNDVLTVMHHKDKRPMFVYPWFGRTLVGTTDLDHKDDLRREPHITREEVDYLIAELAHQFPEKNISEDDVIASFAGVRPVIASGKGVNPSAERRDHAVWDHEGLITVSGGKLTTFRVIANDVMKKAKAYLGSSKAQTLPRKALFHQAANDHNASDDPYMAYLAAAFGQAFASLQQTGEDLTPLEGTPHCAAELAYALKEEQVVHLDDLLLRRTRIGLLMRQGGAEHKELVQRLCMQHGGWTEAQFASEWERYQGIWKESYYLPSA